MIGNKKNFTLVDQIVRQPQKFDLMQSISLLEKEAVNKGFAPLGINDGRPVSVRFSGKVSLSFEASDLTMVKTDLKKNHAYLVQSPFMVLVGTGGAMPEPFTELVMLRNSVKDFSTSEFLDIFHNKFLTLFYLARKKRFPGLSWESPDRSIVAKASNFLASLGREKKNSRKEEDINWVKHTGLLCGIPRSMAGLLSLLKDRFDLKKIDGDQFVGCWHSLEPENISRLDKSKQASILGKSAVLGKKFWDQTAGIKLSISNLSWDSLQDFLPGGSNFLTMKKIIHRYLSRDLRVEILLEARKSEIKTLQLSHKNSNKLGFTTWIRSKKTRNFQAVKFQFDISDINQNYFFENKNGEVF